MADEARTDGDYEAVPEEDPILFEHLGPCCDEGFCEELIQHDCGSWKRPGERCRACDPFDDHAVSLHERIEDALRAAYERNDDDLPGYVAAIEAIFEHVGFVSHDCGPSGMFYEAGIEPRFDGDTPVYRLVSGPTKAELLRPHGAYCSDAECPDHPPSNAGGES